MNGPRLLAAAVCLAAPGVHALPPDFAISEFVSGLRDPATMAFAPDDRLFVGERIEGRLRIVTASGQLLGSPFLTLDVPPVRHRSGGLRGFAFDPAFPSEPYLYVFYTKQFPGNVRHNRISRFTVSSSDPNRADPASEQVLMELPFNDHPLGSSGSHNGGAVVFGGDGKLYVTTGDGWNASAGYGAGDDVQSLSTFTGKVLRLNRDGSIPADNPFYGQASGNYRAIFALGLRNPYAAAVHPVTGEVFVFDVGTANGGNKDDIFRVAAGANFGHDGYGGIGNRTTPWASAGTPIVSGGVWYFADQFPETYRERLFVTSWRKGLKTVHSLTDPVVEDFGSADVNNQGPLYPAVGPDGSLFFLDSTYETSNGRIYQIRYTNLNRAEPPEIAPNGGRFVGDVTVSLSATTPGSEIRFTLDGSDPGAMSPLYVGPFSLTTTATVRARAFAPGFDPSIVTASLFEVIPQSAPSFTNTLPDNAELGRPFVFDLEATGAPAPLFSLDSAPAGMQIHPVTGEVFWVPEAPGAVTVSIRASNGVNPDAVWSGTVTVDAMRTTDAPDPATLSPGGLRYSYFEDSAEAASAGVIATPDLSIRGRDTNFELRFKGFLEIPAGGSYQFRAADEGGTGRVFIGGVEVTGTSIGLAAGLHAFTVRFEANTTGSPTLDVRWSGPGLADQSIPASAFHHFSVPYGIHAAPSLPAYLGTFPPDESGPIPSRLSETGAFADLATLEPAPGLVPYRPNSILWSDRADKLRWIGLPWGRTIGFNETSAWDFPAGTVLIKHFQIGSSARRIETRFEIVKEDGSSYLVTYRWREDQSEADLVPTEGADGWIPVDDGGQQWFFPSRAQCVQCHNSSVRYVLGANTRQLNGAIDYASGERSNQLRTWGHLGMFDAPPAESSLGDLDALCSITDTSASLDERVRSYLDSNCANCHNPAGSPEGTGFVLDYLTPLAESGLLSGAVANDLGLGAAARIVAPRDPRNSVLYQRIAGNDPATRMPPLGRTIVHAGARETLVEWILSLDPANTLVDVPDHARRWTFDGNTGTGTWRDNDETPVYEAGRIGQALRFDGVDDAVDLGPLDVSGETALTITFWFRADDFGTSDARFISKADGQYDQDHYWMISTLNGSRLRLRLRAGGSTDTLISPTGTLSTGVWTHVAATYDGSTMRLYRDGTEVASMPKTGVLDSSGTVDAAIGNQPTTASGGARPFDGLIDDLRIYSRALSEAEIRRVRDA